MGSEIGLEIRLLGPFDARIGSNALPHLRTRKGQHLLALLALRIGREVQREWLAANIWPESDLEKGYYNLRRSLSDLRGALGCMKDLISSPTPHSLRLEPDPCVSVDAQRFDDLIRSGDDASLERAIALYRGPLLEGWQEEWILSDREALQQTSLKALDRLAASAAERQDWAESSRWLKRLVAMDAYREDAHRRLMKALGRTGDHASAILIYRDLRMLLRRDLNVEPAAETVALLNQLKADGQHNTEQPPHATAVRKETQSEGGGLPLPLTSFIGRESEIVEIMELIAGSRLVTLVGSGGIGKTRLAIRVAEELSAETADGVWFVDLVQIADSRRVARAAAQSLRLREQPGRSPMETLIDHLREKQLLLLLDNCEHVLAECASLVEELMRECPGVRILATSRQALEIEPETQWRVPSFPVPNPRRLTSKSDGLALVLPRYESARLFVERAAAVMPAFTLTEHNAPAVLHIIRRLDGIPLAIELAAARVRILTAEQVAARLDDRFRLLSRGSPAAPNRHQTLRAAIDWSHDLLSTPERILFRRLAVFTGSWTLGAAEQACSNGSEIDVFETLFDLVERSLVLADSDQGDERRYRMLETIREYALERLRESGEGGALRARHLDYFLTIAEESPETGARHRWLSLLEIEHANLLAALDTSVERSDEAQSALRLCSALRPFWFHRGYFAEGRDRCEAALSLKGARAQTRARAGVLQTAGVMAQQGGDSVAARMYLEESLFIWRKLGDRHGIANAIHELAIVECEQGEFAEAWRLNEKSLAIFRELGDKEGIANLLSGLGVIAFNRGDYPLSRSLHEESLTIRHELGQSWGVGFALAHLAAVLVELGEYTLARSSGSESIAILGKYGEKSGIAWCLDAFGIMAARTGNPRRGAHLMASAERMRTEIGTTIPPGERERYEHGRESARFPLGEEAFAFEWDRGAAMTVEQAVSLALSDGVMPL